MVTKWGSIVWSLYDKIKHGELETSNEIKFPIIINTNLDILPLSGSNGSILIASVTGYDWKTLPLNMRTTVLTLHFYDLFLLVLLQLQDTDLAITITWTISKDTQMAVTVCWRKLETIWRKLTIKHSSVTLTLKLKSSKNDFLICSSANSFWP